MCGGSRSRSEYLFIYLYLYNNNSHTKLSFQLTCGNLISISPTPSPPRPPHPTRPYSIPPCTFLCFRNGDFLNLTLDKFETFHVLQIKSNADFTGAHVISNKPIGMVSGNRKIPVPAKPPGSADHLTEMMMPVDTWGKSFLTSSTPDRSLGDVFRIVSSEDNTTVLLNGTAMFISKAGDFLVRECSLVPFSRSTGQLKRNKNKNN